MNPNPSMRPRHAVDAPKRPKPPIPVATDITIHLRDLQQRLAEADLCLTDVLRAIPPELAKAEARRAHGRIIKHNQRSYELSEPMRVLPADRLYGLALRGMWTPFPVSPTPYYEQLRAKFNWRRYHEEDDFCLTYLRGRMTALLALDLDYQTEEALTLIGQIAAEQKRFDLFEALAAEMGTRAWKRIILMADAAVKSRKRDLADRVFQAALSCEDGDHRDFLSKKHTQLLQGEWNPDPRK